ncbi:hypothetical protein GLOIN_2v1838155 [Rhizophagus irregularis DAOM 181602=DAOM 197198]|uniref:Galactose oxidase n=3 Tax=Rhizophagus irregularis TaxID=588596 RepID=A0A2P4QF96_RHIID|nr:hypothetical protein GLOIN_2v1838155 [Rhizophagus irregularis DAOM 181602=DAOM 197198]POG76311.1 hypothetical protein GLOIN_2v1838155 [Rhizophagus irregularis DAOM 181602=DAOM 197198]|eukprot:XP_025183177.1 hypothetical protein GLOIN_2v1838155 [Rhizophagus irregularis DAOM 181602=DAOM 197198]
MYFRYSIFFFVFFSQLIIISPYTLVGRIGHTASYMDNKIYFFGGMTKKYPAGTNDFFYLDVSIPFNLDSTLLIVDLSNDARQIYPHYNGVSTICGPNKDTIFLICRVSKESFSYRFINNKEWVPGTVISNVQWSSAVCNKNGSYIYIYGYPDNVNKYMMTISIDTTHWNTVSYEFNITNSLAPEILLPDGRIAYIGERINGLWVNFRNIYIYDTNDGTWRNMSTSGIEPSLRASHTAVLTQDGLIIIYGGINKMGSPVPDQISVLDTKVDPFTWSFPNIDPAPSSAPFSDHTATLVGNYMIIAFGHTTDDVFSDQIHMIDVSEKNNYKWVKSFTPIITKTAKSAIIGGTSGSIATTPNNTKIAYPAKSPGADHAAIIGGTTGGIATVIIIISVSYLLYCRKKTLIYAPQAKHAINC